MRRSSAPLLLLVLLAAAPAMAQVQSRPTDAPIVTADSAAWYVAREPIEVGADTYYPAGATAFFNGNTMVRTGNYKGVPLYSDATLEPHSVVYVPISRGLMRPYERRREGDLAGTTGSRTPSFPVGAATTTTTATPPPAGVPPSTPAVPGGAATLSTPERKTGTSGTSEPVAVGTSGISPPPTRRPQDRVPLVTLARPVNNDGLWIQYLGEKWVASGTAVPFTSGDFRAVGSYSGFPVYARLDTSGQVIYLPTREGLVAPYRLKQ
jgi:hypothetical protein